MLSGRIDELSNLKKTRAYFFSGTKDFWVTSNVSALAAEFYGHYDADVKTDFSLSAGHVLPTKSFGVKCSKTSSPYLGKCGVDGVSAALAHILPDIGLEARRVTEVNSSNLYSFY